MAEGLRHRLKPTDGLRALAVVAVVLFHSFPDLAPGGFIGVDIFFVISGFVISLVYERELVEKATSFRTFYARRVKRLAPAYIVLVVVVTMIALWIMRPRDLLNYGWALVFQGFYAQNIAFWNIGDYFEGPLSKPLLHTWSLAVEEQFYLLFPFFILALARSLKWRAPLLLIAAGTSLLIGFVIAGISPKTSFFWLPTRVWEFAAGIAAAGVYRHRPVIGATGRTLVCAGTAFLIAAIFLFDERSAMPSFQTLLAVAGTSAVLLGQKAGLTGAYEHPLAQHFGRMSYSWYLWHWPPLAFYFLAVGTRPAPIVAVLIVLLGYGLGGASYVLIEQRTRKLALRPRAALAVVTAFCLAAVLTGVLVLSSGGFVRDYPPEERALLAAQLDVPPYRCPFLRRVEMWDRSVCRITKVPGNPVLLIGDSHADRFKAALADLPLLITKQNCTIMEYGTRPNCDWAGLVRDASNLKVSSLLLIAHWRQDYTARDYEQLEARLSAIPIPVVVLLPTPEGREFDPSTYLASGRFPEFVDVTRQQFERKTSPFRNALVAIASRNPRLKLIDPLPTLCQPKCRFSLGAAPIWRDDNHVTLAGAQLLTPAIREAMRRSNGAFLLAKDRTDSF